MKLNYQKKITRRVTIKDLAESLGLSVGAVSQALNPRENINIKLKPETIARVRKYANQLNYRPHAGASSIRSKHFSNIGYMVAKDDPNAMEPVAAQYGMHDASLEHNFRLNMIRLPSIEARNRDAVSRVFQESHLDALIILNATNFMPEGYQMALAETDFPVIHLNNKQDFQAVYVNDYGGAYTLTEHLLQQEYRKIAYFKVQDEAVDALNTAFSERYYGFTEAMKAAGLSFDKPWFFETEGEEKTLEWLRDPATRPEAIVCYSDADASLLCRLAYQQGLRIPDDIAVTGFNDDAAAKFSWVPLTTMAVPYYQMAYAAFNRAVAQINSERPMPFASICVEPRFCIRASSLRPGVSIANIPQAAPMAYAGW
jgi:LacI family transcriptional regulator